MFAAHLRPCGDFSHVTVSLLSFDDDDDYYNYYYYWFLLFFQHVYDVCKNSKCGIEGGMFRGELSCAPPAHHLQYDASLLLVVSAAL